MCQLLPAGVRLQHCHQARGVGGKGAHAGSHLVVGSAVAAQLPAELRLGQEGAAVGAGGGSGLQDGGRGSAVRAPGSVGA